MKKSISLFFIFVLFAYVTFSQNLSLSNAYGSLNPGDTVTSYFPNDLDYAEHVYVTNNSASAIDVKVRKEVILLLTNAYNTFCWGQCFSPTTLESPNPVTVGAGETNSNGFYADYNANGENGLTIVRYTFFNANNLSDTADVILKFYTTPASVNENLILKAEISNPYPNPSSGRCQFSYSIPVQSADVRLVIMDLTGNIVHSVSLLPGEGKTTIDVTSFASGIYFYSLWIGNSAVTTRKMIVQK